MFTCFNCVRRCNGAYAEQEFVDWFRKEYHSEHFIDTKVSDSIFYDLDLVKIDGTVLKIEFKTVNGKARKIQILGSSYPIDVSLASTFTERQEYARTRLLSGDSNKFDFLAVFYKTVVDVFPFLYFADNISKCYIKEKYEVSFRLPKPIVMVVCKYCGSEFPSNKDVICSTACKKDFKKKGEYRKRVMKKGVVVVYPGRFIPFCNHHKKVYNKLQSKFGTVNIVTRDSGWKKEMIKKYGINEFRIHCVANLYSAKEVFDTIGINLDNAIYIVAVGEKDKDRLIRDGMKKDGDEYYFKKFTKLEDSDPASKHGYVYIVDNVVASKKTKEVSSASSLRTLLFDERINMAEKLQIWKTRTHLNEQDLQIFLNVEGGNHGCECGAHTTPL